MRIRNAPITEHIHFIVQVQENAVERIEITFLHIFPAFHVTRSCTKKEREKNEKRKIEMQDTCIFNNFAAIWCIFIFQCNLH